MGSKKTDMMNNEYIVSTYNAHDLRNGYEFGLRWTKLPRKKYIYYFFKCAKLNRKSTNYNLQRNRLFEEHAVKVVARK